MPGDRSQNYRPTNHQMHIFIGILFSGQNLVPEPTLKVQETDETRRSLSQNGSGRELTNEL